MHAISSYSGRATHTHTHPQTGPITIHCAAASAQCNVTTKSKRSKYARSGQSEAIDVSYLLFQKQDEPNFPNFLAQDHNAALKEISEKHRIWITPDS